jgi:hypothetical protein
MPAEYVKTQHANIIASSSVLSSVFLQLFSFLIQNGDRSGFIQAGMHGRARIAVMNAVKVCNPDISQVKKK